jgi:hypothetical protein
MYWARRFRRHLNRHSLSRITEISTFPVPEIFVEGDDADARSVAPSADGDDTRRSMRATVDFSDRHASLRDMIGGLGMGGLHSRDGSVDSRGSRGAISGLGSGTSSPSRSPRLRPHRTNSSVSGAAMDLSDVVPARREGMHSRSGSTAGEMAVEAFNDSAWGASMRRSYTTRRSGDRRT